METITFEVVGFHGTYHAILGRPCYAKFMAVPNYTYLKLKMSGPHRVIIVGTKRLTKVLMDGGSGLNIMYAEMLDAMGIDRARIRPTGAPFHGIMPRKQAGPLG